MLRKRRVAVKLAIMNSQLVVGVGNIYASEALFRAGIRPGRAARSLTRAECTTLAASIKTVLSEAILAGGTTLQLGLYAEAAIQHLGATAASASYWMIDPRANYSRYGYEWTPERRQRFLDVATAIIDGIEKGVFLALPGEWDTWRNTHENCTWCEFDAVCPRDRGEQSEAKATADAHLKNDCSKNDVRMQGSTWIAESTCTFSGMHIVGHTETTFSGDEAFHSVVTSSYDSPKQGATRSVMTVDSKYLGACAPGQKPGVPEAQK